ncbi:MAG TPA: hypothetical protein VFL83_21360 [Anaeromyxobacter sp.]|nr:hypothetical protein [Anaeromyxobacter sp.]
MANTYQSGSAVRSGYYFNAARWHVEPIAEDGGRLPAGAGSWVKVPTAVALLLVPILGATFLMFLPLIGFVMLFRAIGVSVLGAFRASASDLAATMSPGWQPGEAHFTGKSPEHAGVEEKGPTPRGDALDALAEEIERRRRA